MKQAGIRALLVAYFIPVSCLVYFQTLGTERTWCSKISVDLHTISQTTEFYSLSLFPVAPTLEHRTSVKRFVSLQFLNSKTVSRTPWMGDQPVARPLPIQTQSKHRQTSMPWVGIVPTILVLGRAKTVRALGRVALWPAENSSVTTKFLMMM
jgi:hypothetical protein